MEVGRIQVDVGERVVEPFLRLAGRVADRYTPVDRIKSQRRRVADVAAALAREPELAEGALLELAINAVTAEHFAQVDEAAADNLNLAWRVATTRAARGDYDEDAVKTLLERDPDPDTPFNALAVRTARPLAEAKEEAWQAPYVDQSVPSGLSMYWMVLAFWRPEQREVLMPFTSRYLEEIPKLAGGGMLKIFGLIRSMFPDVGDQAFLDAADAMASDDSTDPMVRGALLVGTDTLARRLRARPELD